MPNKRTLLVEVFFVCFLNYVGILWLHAKLPSGIRRILSERCHLHGCSWTRSLWWATVPILSCKAWLEISWHWRIPGDLFCSFRVYCLTLSDKALIILIKKKKKKLLIMLHWFAWEKDLFLQILGMGKLAMLTPWSQLFPLFCGLNQISSFFF